MPRSRSSHSTVVFQVECSAGADYVNGARIADDLEQRASTLKLSCCALGVGAGSWNHICCCWFSRSGSFRAPHLHRGLHSISIWCGLPHQHPELWCSTFICPNTHTPCRKLTPHFALMRSHFQQSPVTASLLYGFLCESSLIDPQAQLNGVCVCGHPAVDCPYDS